MILSLFEVVSIAKRFHFSKGDAKKRKIHHYLSLRSLRLSSFFSALIKKIGLFLETRFNRTYFFISAEEIREPQRTQREFFSKSLQNIRAMCTAAPQSSEEAEPLSQAHQNSAHPNPHRCGQEVSTHFVEEALR